MNRKRVDIVVPLFNEIEIIPTLHQRLVESCSKLSIEFRIIYVDDGSHDGTSDWIQANTTSQHSVRVVKLARNFGQPAAITAGLAETTDADCVVVMDGDGQDPPELIKEMVAKWQTGVHVVIPQRRSRKESLVRGIAFRSFHRLFAFLSDSMIPRNTGTFCLLDRRAVVAIGQLNESHRFFPGLRAWIGFRQAMLPFDRPGRLGGEPKQTFKRLVKYALDAIFGYSLKPLRLVTLIGMIVCCASFALACWFITKRMVGWETASIGFTTLTCAVFGLGGFQLVGIGILGEYIGRIYDEVKRRPPYVVAEQFDSTEDIDAKTRLAA